MLLARLPVLSALLVLLLAAGRCPAAVLLRGSGHPGSGHPGSGHPGSGHRADALMEPGGRYQRTEPAELSGYGVRGLERERRSHQGPEGHPRDPRHKEKFIKHLTGPLYFNPKCRKHFNRLYHNTRDCTIPAFYRRCARLLTRLANSPRCTER